MTDQQFFEDIVVGTVGIALEMSALPLIDGPVDAAEQTGLIEALLISAPGPSAISALAEGAGLPLETVERALAEIEARPNAGWSVQHHRGTVQLITAPRYASYVRRFLGLEREVRLSPAALETLAIIAYRQPVTRSDIEAVRGVDSTGVLSTLLGRGLVEQSGRSDSPGQPYQYQVTPAFLQHFGFTSLEDLPDLDGAGAANTDQRLGDLIENARELIASEPENSSFSESTG